MNKQGNLVSIRNSVVRGGLLSGGSFLALAMCATPVLAQAQDEGLTDDPVTEDDNAIVVTGIRQQLETSQAIKRDSDTFVDAVTADDIGALPDKSVTEALQRVPGVTINRFQGQDDPLHFSVEGSNVVIRGLSYVRSEFNGRDAFSVNTGRALSFTDVSPELLSSVEVFKNGTPDRIEGGISGVVNLNTRKPFDRRQLVVAGTLEGLYGDITEKVTPSFSGLISNVFPSSIGDFGILVSYGQSRLKSTAYGTQIDETQFRPDLSPDGEQYYVPRGGGVRVQEFNRYRNTFDASLQWESNDESAKVTLEYIRALSKLNWSENTAELDNFTRPVGVDQRTQNFGDNPFVFDSDGILESGNYFNPAGLSPVNLSHRNQDTRSKNEDFSARIELHPTERLSFVFDGQYARADTRQFDITLLDSVDQDVGLSLDRSGGGIPNIQVLPVNGSDPDSVFANPDSVFYRAVLDHVERSEGDEKAFRADGAYDFDTNFLKAIRFGGRYSDREQTRRYTNYAWGFVSQNWAGDGISPLSSAPPVGNLQPFTFPDFHRGSVVSPLNSIYTASDIAALYQSGAFQDLVQQHISAAPGSGQAQFLVGRPGVIDGTYYLPGEINSSREESFAAYARADFLVDGIFGDNTSLNGSFGVRYVNTFFETAGFVTAAIGNQELQQPDGNGIATVTPTAAAIAASDACTNTTSQRAPFCDFTPAQQQQYFAFLNGASSAVNVKTNYDNWLPSVNANLKLGDRFIVRAAFQKAISRPDFGVTAFSTTIGGNGQATATNGVPIFASGGGDPRLGAIKSDNYDLGLEYYFGASSSLTLNLFYKKLSDIIATGSTIQPFTNNGVTADVAFTGPTNVGTGSIKGLEVGYAQFYDFLPGPLAGLGFQGNFTYVDPSTFPVQVSEGTYAGLQYPLMGLSKYTFNASALYEKYGISARATYNWRSQYLLAPRDVIIPYAPIYVPDGGQLDASIFYAITPNIKFGVQATNLLNQVTRTLQQTTYDASGLYAGDAGYTAVEGPLAPRSFFTNDRRFSFGVRFNF